RAGNPTHRPGNAPAQNGNVGAAPLAWQKSLGGLSALPTMGALQELRHIMWQYVSLCRDHQGLLEAKRRVEVLWNTLPPAGTKEYNGGQVTPRQVELVNMLQVAGLVIDA